MVKTKVKLLFCASFGLFEWFKSDFNCKKNRIFESSEEFLFEQFLCEYICFVINYGLAF